MIQKKKKEFSKIGVEGNFLNPMKAHTWHHAYWWKAGASPKTRNQTRRSRLTTSVQHYVLFSDDMSYIYKTLKNPLKKLKLIHKFSKFVECKTFLEEETSAGPHRRELLKEAMAGPWAPRCWRGSNPECHFWGLVQMVPLCPGHRTKMVM